MAFIYFSMRSKLPIYHGKINKKICPFTGVFGFIFPWWKCWKNKIPLKTRLIKIRKRPYMGDFASIFSLTLKNLKRRGNRIRSAAAFRLRLHSGRHGRRASLSSCGASLTRSLPAVVRGPYCAIWPCKTACPTGPVKKAPPPHAFGINKNFLWAGMKCQYSSQSYMQHISLDLSFINIYFHPPSCTKKIFPFLSQPSQAWPANHMQ